MKRIIFSIALIVISLGCFAQSKGYEKTLEIFGGPGLGEESKYSLGIAFSNGYRFNEKTFIGVGAAFKYAECLYFSSHDYDSRDNKYLIPIYARLKYNLTETNTSPYLMADAGWTIDVGQNENKNLEGFFFEPQFGLDFKLDGIGIFAAVGVNVQNYHYQYFSKTETTENQYMLGTLNLHFGVKF